jgi:hypothetical protein
MSKNKKCPQKGRIPGQQNIIQVKQIDIRSIGFILHISDGIFHDFAIFFIDAVGKMGVAPAYV